MAAACRLVSPAHGVRSRAAQIIKMDQDLLSHPMMGRIARGAGTTSNVLYFSGKRLYVACSGDSRAVMGRASSGSKARAARRSAPRASRPRALAPVPLHARARPALPPPLRARRCRGGRTDGRADTYASVRAARATQVVAVDLSQDHKPELPHERKRIEAAGGVVSAAGPRGLPPSRVWVNGRVGLAMSRSIGDGEAKDYGVVPDPEVRTFDLKLPTPGKNDGDRFVIVASDGVWEFITSQQAVDVVKRHTSAAAASKELVGLAEQRWQEGEGSYRDDITCIVAFLPFLEATKEGEQSFPDTMVDIEVDIENPEGEPTDDATKGDTLWANKSWDQVREEGDDFVKRRLSMHHPEGDDEVDA